MRNPDDTHPVAEEGTLLSWLCTAASSGPEVGLRFLDRRERPAFETWGTLRAKALEVAAGLSELGVHRGQRVALIFPTGVGFFHGFFGALLAGAVPVPLYPPVRLGRLDEYHRRTATMLDAASARLVLADPRVLRILGPTLAAAEPDFGGRTLRDVLLAGSAAENGASAEAGGLYPDPVDVEPSDLALVQFSSGTTVDPKPVALSHRAIVAQVRALNACWPDTQDVRHSGVSWLPLYHDMGLIGCVFPALERPSVLTLIGPEVFVARPAVWLRAMSTYRATISVAPNFAFGLCVDKIRDDELAGVDLSGWRVALNGAEPVSPNVLRSFQERFARWGFRPEALTPVYGLSEATLAVTFSDLDRPFTTARFDRGRLAEGWAELRADGVELPTVGRPLPGTDVRVSGPCGEHFGEGRVGRVEVRGPSLMDSYLDRPEATATAVRDGWLDTGDQGFLHGGELYLTGRGKDLVILRGRNYLPADIEQALDGIPGVRKGCGVAVGHVPEGSEGERLMILLELRPDANRRDVESLERRVTEAILAKVGVLAETVVPLDPGTLPRTSSGKLRRGEALRLYLSGELVPPKRVTPWLIAGAMARSALALRRSRGSR
ncbi:MAG: AMP-binding protein [Acidobacteriota bacterium]